ncbi:MAG: SAM-dependent methyltransferase [Myxococcales bacterium]|nr:SAM-dependent methyltransferase [Myxococcales bacterium]
MAPRDQLESEPTSLDRLAGDWRIHQLVGGHRFSADDLFTAWVAAESRPDAARLLDLGAGIGSVGLMTLWRMLPSATLVALEAQQVSHRLMRRTVDENRLGARVECRLGDLRDAALVPEGPIFDLVTGSPPYIPLGKGVVSPHPQRAACRMELRGSIVDYAMAAARTMRDDGMFVVCFAAADPRGEQALAAAGLALRVRQDVVFRARQAPLITVLVATRRSGPCDRRAPFCIRGPDGEWTEPYFEMRRRMGTEVSRPARPSPDEVDVDRR